MPFGIHVTAQQDSLNVADRGAVPFLKNVFDHISNGPLDPARRLTSRPPGELPGRDLPHLSAALTRRVFNSFLIMSCFNHIRCIAPSLMPFAVSTLPLCPDTIPNPKPMKWPTFSKILENEYALVEKKQGLAKPKWPRKLTLVFAITKTLKPDTL
jgi:hypothetical protein